QKITYATKPTPSGVYRIFTMDRNGNNKQQISFGDSGTDMHPDWSPDQRQIAFHSFRENMQGIWRLNLSTNEIQQIAPSHKFAVRPLWSPDGRWVAFVSRPEDLDGPGDIFITDLDETIVYKLTSTRSTWYRLISWKPNVN
ncbi:MAG: hypothetical protein GY797_16765, partial [Deltaproteobacteria bacterium]|nr:hypothetical protein [Deltaproteobacteria bacterium]